MFGGIFLLSEVLVVRRFRWQGLASDRVWIPSNLKQTCLTGDAVEPLRSEIADKSPDKIGMVC